MPSEIVSHVQEVSTDPWAFWSVIVAAFSAFIAAVAAALSLYQANLSRQQVVEDRKVRQVEAAMKFSPYLSDSYQLASQAMVDRFGPLRIGASPPSLSDLKEAFSDRKLYSQWMGMLNHWGRLATAYYSGVIDRDVVNEMHRYGFVTFMKFFQGYFEKYMSTRHYKHMIKLYEEWKDL